MVKKEQVPARAVFVQASCGCGRRLAGVVLTMGEVRAARRRATSCLPALTGAGPTTYDTRGWTTFERCSAELGAKPSKLGFAKWKLVIDVASRGGETAS